MQMPASSFSWYVENLPLPHFARLFQPTIRNIQEPVEKRFATHQKITIHYAAGNNKTGQRMQSDTLRCKKQMFLSYLTK